MGRKREERKRKEERERKRETRDLVTSDSYRTAPHFLQIFTFKPQNKLSPIASLPRLPLTLRNLWWCWSQKQNKKKWLVLFISSHFAGRRKTDGWHCLQGRNKGRTQTVDGGSSLARDTAAEKPGSQVALLLFQLKHDITLREKNDRKRRALEPPEQGG